MMLRNASIFVRFENGMSFTFEKGWAANMSGLAQGIFIFGSKGAFRGNALLVEQDGKIVEEQLNMPDMPNASLIGNFLRVSAIENQSVVGKTVKR